MKEPGQNAMLPTFGNAEVRAYWTTVHVDGGCNGCTNRQVGPDGQLVDTPVMQVQVGQMCVRVCRSCRMLLLASLGTEPPL